MTISKMTKVIIAGSLQEYRLLLAEMQKANVIHLDNPAKLFPAEWSYFQNCNDIDYDNQTHERLIRCYQFLSEYRKSQHLINSLLYPVSIASSDDYNNTINSFDIISKIREWELLQTRIQSLKNEISQIEEEQKQIKPWRSITIQHSQIRSVHLSTFFLGGVQTAVIDHLATIASCDIEILHPISDKEAAVIIACHKIDHEKVQSELNQINFVPCHPSKNGLSCFQQYTTNRHKLSKLDDELISCQNEAKQLALLWQPLLIFLNHYDSHRRRLDATQNVLSTQKTFILAGWVDERSLPEIRAICHRFSSVEFEQVPIHEKEQPPTKLDNKWPYSIFQFITNLYDRPAYNSLNPSSFLFLFFIPFLGLTITDAGYGLVLVLVASIGIVYRKDLPILWILCFGGLFTIICGVLTGSYFADLIHRIFAPIEPPFWSWIDNLIWFDPIKEPMVFFRLVLLLGYIQILCGLSLGFYIKLRQGQVLEAVMEKLIWLLVLIFFGVILFSSNLARELTLTNRSEPLLPSLWYTVGLFGLATAALSIFTFHASKEKSFPLNLLVGGLKLFIINGLFSLLGDLLSYMRLMALGMVTIGIGMAVNTLAFMVIDLPVIGKSLALLFLIIGHTFNLVINLIGGFVHTLRLQYVEFFSKFFEGGGKEFQPLAVSHNYISITK